MNLSFKQAKQEDIEVIFHLCKQLIDDYEQLEMIDYSKVIEWIYKKIEKSIDEYTVVYYHFQKVGYYHFYKNTDNVYELDDLYIFSEFQNLGIGTAIITHCLKSVNDSVMLYVFIQNKRAVSLYQRMGFEIIEKIGNSRYIMKNNH